MPRVLRLTLLSSALWGEDSEMELEVSWSGDEETLFTPPGEEMRSCTFKFCSQLRLVKLLSSNETSSSFSCTELDFTWKKIITIQGH